MAMFIGELARRTGASPKAIRLYESLGLLGSIRRNGAYRIYHEENCRQIRLIRQAQSLGFRLAELAPLLQSGHGTSDWNAALAQIERKRESIRQDIEKLQRIESELAIVSQEIRGCLDTSPHSSAGECASLAGTSQDGNATELSP